jgi:GAF domain-containing protein
MLGVPVMVDDDLIGVVVVVVRRDPQSFTGEHVALVQTFADQAAIAIRNARLMGNRFGRPVPAYEVRGLAATP